MIKNLNKDQEKKVYRALLALNETSSEVYFLLKNTSIRTDAEIPTAYAAYDTGGKKFVICVREEWINTFDTYNMAAIIEHELYHIILCHVASMNSFEDRQVANIAWDAIINDLGHYLKDRSKLNAQLKQGVFLDQVRKDLQQYGILTGYNTISAKNTTCRALYDLLMKLQAKMPKLTGGYSTTDDHSKQSLDKSKGQGDGKGEQDGQSLEGLGDSKGALEQLSKSKEAQELIKEIMGSDSPNGESARKIGTGSADLTVYLEGYYKAKRIKDFKKSINNFYSCSKNFTKRTSIKNPSRRFPGNPFGKVKVKKARVKLCIDTSGSQMNDECIEKINIAICNALDLNLQVDVVSGDTKKTFEKKNVTRTWNFKECLKGNGGTELEFFFHDKNGKVIDEALTYVIVTDGYFDKEDIPRRISKNKILFLSTSHMTNIFGYKTLKI